METCASSHLILVLFCSVPCLRGVGLGLACWPGVEGEEAPRPGEEALRQGEEAPRPGEEAPKPGEEEHEAPRPARPSGVEAGLPS